MKFSFTRNIAAVALVSIMLTGCFQEAEPVHDVEWYKTHDAERQAKLKECSNNPGELRDTPNCENAVQAEKALSFGKPKDIQW